MITVNRCRRLKPAQVQANEEDMIASQPEYMAPVHYKEPFFGLFDDDDDEEDEDESPKKKKKPKQKKKKNKRKKNRKRREGFVVQDELALTRTIYVSEPWGFYKAAFWIIVIAYLGKLILDGLIRPRRS